MDRSRKPWQDLLSTPAPPFRKGGEAHLQAPLATEIKGLLAQGERDTARERFGALVAAAPARALRVAFQYSGTR